MRRWRRVRRSGASWTGSGWTRRGSRWTRRRRPACTAARGRLDALEAGDPATSMRAVLSWSARHLDPAAAAMFRLLGTHPGPDVSAAAAASLAGLAPRHARETLGALTRAHLIGEHVPGRF